MIVLHALVVLAIVRCFIGARKEHHDLIRLEQSHKRAEHMARANRDLVRA